MMLPAEENPAWRTARVIDALLTLAVFVFFTWILRSHVPSYDPVFIWLWGAVSASCMAALFWLALQMFRSVLQAQFRTKNREAGPPSRRIGNRE
jgi:hypothetical protein